MIRVVSDTAANLSKELIDKLKITIVNFQYFVDGKLQGNDFDGKKYMQRYLCVCFFVY